MEEYQRRIPIIKGIEIFFQNNQVEASAHDEIVAKERQPVKTITKKEKEEILKPSPIEKEEDIVDLFTHWEMDLNMLEDWLDNQEPEDHCQKIAMLEGEEYQHEEQLEEVGVEPRQEDMTEVNLS
jgi:hypothetical protein